MPTEPTPKIAIRDLYKSFGPKQVLKGVTLDVMPAESLVIIGGSGTGKSVLIKNILGLMKPDKGDILVDGQSTLQLTGSDKAAFMAKCGMLFQGGALFDSLKVWENVAFGLIEGQHMARKIARDMAIDKLAQVGLAPEVGELFPAELSGGMQKRVGLARAIAIQPEIIFFDEPTTGLDPIMADVINNLILKCVRQIGATAFTITHDMGSVRKIADRVAMLHQGQVIWQGRVDELDNSGNPYVDQFIHGRATGPIEMQV